MLIPAAYGLLTLAKGDRSLPALLPSRAAISYWMAIFIIITTMDLLVMGFIDTVWHGTEVEGYKTRQ
jgi:hypothetical protein